MIPPSACKERAEVNDKSKKQRALLSAYAEDPGCQAGDECVGRILRSSAVKDRAKEADDASVDSAEGFKVPRALARGAPFSSLL